MRRETDEAGLALLLGLLQGVHNLAGGIERVSPARFQAGDPPQIRVFLLGVPEQLVQRRQESLGGAVVRLAHLFSPVREGEIHFVAAPAEGPGIPLDLVVPAGIDVVDARVHAAIDDLPSLLVIAA